jgi:murein DD-endopeptidase MepM/ murein hydrolase activator NlpD
MNSSYSILVLRGTQLHRFVVSRQGLRYVVLLGILLLCSGAWSVNDYLAVERKKVEEVTAKAQAQQEKLSALRERTKEVQEALARWKSVREKMQASLPRRHRASADPQLEGDELHHILAVLQGELKAMIASVPSDWPVQGRVVSGVGMRPSPWTGEMEFHSGLDIANSVGTPVHAAGDAIVESVEQTGGKGKAIVLNHGQEIKTQYAHLSKILVNEGDRVSKGQEIAHVGNTGKSTGPHLHYEVRVNGVPIDPRKTLIREDNQLISSR